MRVSRVAALLKMPFHINNHHWKIRINPIAKTVNNQTFLVDDIVSKTPKWSRRIHHRHTKSSDLVLYWSKIKWTISLFNHISPVICWVFFRAVPLLFVWVYLNVLEWRNKTEHHLHKSKSDMNKNAFVAQTIEIIYNDKAYAPLFPSFRFFRSFGCLLASYVEKLNSRAAQEFSNGEMHLQSSILLPITIWIECRRRRRRQKNCSRSIDCVSQYKILMWKALTYEKKNVLQ